METILTKIVMELVFGTAELDDCGICDGNNTDQDCNGTVLELPS